MPNKKVKSETPRTNLDYIVEFGISPWISAGPSVRQETYYVVWGATALLPRVPRPPHPKADNYPHSIPHLLKGCMSIYCSGCDKDHNSLSFSGLRGIVVPTSLIPHTLIFGLT